MMENTDNSDQVCLDLSDPNILRTLAEHGVEFVELFGNDDSEIDEEEEERVERGAPGPEEAEDDEPAGSGWRRGASKPEELPFTGQYGMEPSLKDTKPEPVDFFRLMVDEEMVKAITIETNRYASETLQSKNLSPSSRFKKWVAVTVEEMWAFFGLIIVMGLVPIDDLDEYWSTDPVYNFPFFRSIMKRDRFCLILSFFHVCNNNVQPARDSPQYDPLFKIRDFVTSLTKNFTSSFRPGRNIAVDEAMVAWRGPLAFRVYNPDKPAKFGIKVFELCDSETGYCCNLEFYTGKKQASACGATFDVVDRLITPYLHVGRTLYVDNYYTSPDLFTYLRENGTMACGTMRRNSRNGPPKDMMVKLQKGDATAATNGSLNLLRFYDKREVNLLTTAHDDSRVSTGKVNPVTKEPVIKLAAVADYNKFMGAVDRSDQMVSYNAFNRRTLKWWKKAFFHMLMLGVLNSYILFKKYSGKKLSHRVFRRELAKELVKMAPMPVRKFTRDVGDSVILRLTARHFPQIIQPKGEAKQQKPLRNCAVCSGSVRKRSRYECVQCDVGLHVDTCFDLYHTRQDFKRCLKRKQTAASADSTAQP